MTRKQLHDGGPVYHAVMAHWGIGRIVKYQYRDCFGLVRERQWLIAFAHIPGADSSLVWCRPSELRKTPDLKRLTLLAELKVRRV